jgi:hypothetical protein
MKDWIVKFKTYHESFKGYDLCDGWSEYKVFAKDSTSAENKARKLWKKQFPARCWIQNTSIMIAEPVTAETVYEL